MSRILNKKIIKNLLFLSILMILNFSFIKVSAATESTPATPATESTNNKSFYKKTWFWVILIILTIGSISGSGGVFIYYKKHKTSNKTSK